MSTETWRGLGKGPIRTLNQELRSCDSKGQK